MLKKEEIIKLIKNGPFITMQDVKLTMVKQNKDGQITIPRGLLKTKILTPEDEYTLIIIRKN